MTNCIFCKVVEGSLLTHMVHEDDVSMAFLDKYPLTKGHTLVITKKHATNIAELDHVDAEALFRAVYVIVKKVQKALDTDSTTVAVNNGRWSGQEVPHVHAHVVPRFADDNFGPIHRLFTKRPSVPDEEMDTLAEKIRRS